MMTTDALNLQAKRSQAQPTEEMRQKLINLLPEFYAKSPETVELQQAFGIELDAAQATRDDCFLQLDVSTATWGLDLWEKAYGIAKNAGKSDEYRRTRILSKMRGAGTTTAVLIRNVAESFSNGAVEVDEHPGEYRFDVRFVGTLGIPPNMDDLTAVIEEIKPAHLTFAFVFIYRIHRSVGRYTHQMLSAHTHEVVRAGPLPIYQERGELRK